MVDAGEPPLDALTCPHCQSPLDDATKVDGDIVECQTCHQLVATISSERPDNDADVDPSDHDAERAAAERRLQIKQSEELSGLRIRNLSVAKRAAIRQRSYFIVGAWACLVVVGQCVSSIASHVITSQLALLDGVYTLLGMVCFWSIFYFLRQALRLRTEIEASQLAEPLTPPDFSTLSDGSQMAKNLEEVE